MLCVVDGVCFALLLVVGVCCLLARVVSVVVSDRCSLSLLGAVVG